MNRRRSIFLPVVAIVFGVVIYVGVGGASRRLGLAGPAVVTLIIGLAIGALSRSWRIALLSSWLVTLVGLIAMASSTLGSSVERSEPSSLLSGSLLVGGPAGAAAGGYLGARVRGAREATRAKLPEHPALAVIAVALFILGIVLGRGGPVGSQWMALASWFGAAIAAATWVGLRPVASRAAVKPSVWIGLALILAALLCWPMFGWILNGLDQMGLLRDHRLRYSEIIYLLMPLAGFLLGLGGIFVGLVARHRATAGTGRRLASLTAVAGGLLVIAVPIWVVIWFAASMYSCYAVMC
jgi:hypothetical protein